MPKAIKKRVTKKTALRAEEVRGAAVRSLDIIKSRRKLFTLILLISGIVIISIIAFMFYYSSIKKKAYAFEREAYNYYYEIDLKTPLSDEERWEKPLELFQKALKIKSTPTALFYIGNCYFNLGDYDNAIKTYNKFVDKYRNETVILPLVYQKLASAYIKKGENDEAVRTLNALAEFKNGTFKDTALSLEARLYEATGRHEDAIKKYKEIVEDFPLSPWAVEAMSIIKMENVEEGKESKELEPLAPEDQR